MIIGHSKQLNFLKKSLESGRFSHAYLFSGQEKLGKKDVALEFAFWILGENPISHPDFNLIEPILSEETKQIQINQIRDLSWNLSLKPMRSKIKVAIIDQAHTMTQEAQNCLLKTLEEPKGNTVLILITHLQNFLLPTIISRCQIIKFYPVKKTEIENYLKNRNLNQKTIEEILEISQGKPKIALELANSREKLQFYKKRIEELNRILNSNLEQRFYYAKELSEKENLKEILEIWLNYFRNIFIKQQHLSHLEKLKDILQKIQRTIYLISTKNINQRLALEILMMDLNF